MRRTRLYFRCFPETSVESKIIAAVDTTLGAEQSMAGLRAQEGEPFGGNLICDSAGGDMMEVAQISTGNM